MKRPSVRPADLADAAGFRAETDLGAVIGPVLQLFLAVDQNTYDDRLGARFLAACDQLGAWAERRQRPSLAETVAQVAGNFQAVYDSPLDVDADVLSPLWDRLGPELVRLSGESASGDSPVASAKSVANGDSDPDSFWFDLDGPSRGAGPAPGSPIDSGLSIDSWSTGPADVAAPDQREARFVQVEDRHLDQAAEHAWELYAGVHLLGDLEREVNRSEGGSRLAVKIRDVSRDLRTQAEAMKRSVAALRQAPAGLFLAEFTPLVERLARWLGKKIHLSIEGKDVPIDRLLADDLRAPLIDWLENTVRQRIDTPQQRLAEGKSETANLRLAAKQTNGRLRITVRDDGRAVDPAAVSPTALLSPLEGAAPHDAGLDYLPRLEALRNALRPYGGRVRFESDEETGGRLCLDVPSREATSALHGLTLRQGTGTFVVPLEQVLEIVAVGSGDLRSIQGRDVITLHDVTYEAHCLADLLDMERPSRATAEPRGGVLVQDDGRQACLVVDEVLGQRQLVLRRMADIMPGMKQFHGVAPLGDGKLAFVLNVATLLDRASG